jgi:hypothetical protein
MFQRLIFIFSLLFTSSFSFILSAFGESVNVIFTGVIEDYAIFTTPTLEARAEFAAANKSENELNSVINASWSLQSNTSTAVTISPANTVTLSANKSLGTGDTAPMTVNLSINTYESISLPPGKSNFEIDILMEKSADFNSSVNTDLVTVTIIAE